MGWVLARYLVQVAFFVPGTYSPFCTWYNPAHLYLVHPQLYGPGTHHQTKNHHQFQTILTTFPEID